LQECQLAVKKGGDIVSGIHRQGCNIIGFGEMGIGNTTSASILMSQICGYPAAECVGRGAGLDALQLEKKIRICEKAILNHSGNGRDPMGLLATFGGFEIAMICGAMHQAAEKKMAILVDGFISSASFLVAHAINENVKEYALFCHQSDESGHAKMLEFLQVQPILKLNMRLGEGTGAALAYPLVQSSVNFLNEMASFNSAGVSEKNEKGN
jgi:nicotinate-nucleotide--dimethylbenzimidazole phosphoribosyltransferase